MVKLHCRKNQGQCGSCWAHAAAGLLEYYFLIKYGTAYDLSEQNFVDCDKTSNACNGGMPYKAFNYNLANGVDFETIYPYKAVAGTCAYKNTTTTATNGVPKSKAPQWYTFPATENALAYAIKNYGWVSVCVNAAAFQTYGGGIMKSSTLGPNHAVIAVGFGTATDGTKFWIIRNSWGPKWGEGGYARMERDKNTCDIMNTNLNYRNYLA
jgi:C1A family cysteine protease